MRLIDADRLTEEFLSWTMCDGASMYEIERTIDEQPTVDAEPVRHGRWIYKWFDSYCSACGWENKSDTVTRIRNDYPYCPHCGAKMDEVQ